MHDYFHLEKGNSRVFCLAKRVKFGMDSAKKLKKISLIIALIFRNCNLYLFLLKKLHIFLKKC